MTMIVNKGTLSQLSFQNLYREKNLRYLSDPDIVRILLLKMSLLLKAEDLHTLLMSSGVRGDDVRNDLAIVLLCVTTLDTRDSSGSHNIKCWYLPLLINAI